MIGLPDERQVRALAEDLHPRAIITTPAMEMAIQRLLAPCPFDIPIVTCSLPSPAGWAPLKGILSYLIKPITGEMVAAVMRRLDGSEEMTVLLVDDEADAVRLLERLVTSAAHPARVLKAGGGAEALRIMEETVPDVVFMDLLMQGLDGKQTIAAMQDDERLRGVPVVVVSACDWVEGEATIETPISVRLRGPVDLGRGARSLKALLDTLEPRYLSELATGAVPPATDRP